MTTAAEVRAQNQERTLVDRLLRPDMSLVNDGQNKKFRVKTASIDSRATIKTFYLDPKVEQPRFAVTPGISPRQLSPMPFDPVAKENRVGQTRTPETKFPTSSISKLRRTGDAEKRIPTSNFPDQGPFRGEGKSQKSFDRRNAPLTIDEVRELLNENK